MFLQYIESLEKPNFTQAHLVLLELQAEPLYFGLLQDLLESRFKLEHFDPEKPIDEMRFNATQFQLGYTVKGIYPTGLRNLLEDAYSLPSISGLDTMRKCLEAAEFAEKPNFPHFLMRMQELYAGPRSWSALRRLMEKKFSLESFDRFI